MLSYECMKKFGDMVTEGYAKCGRNCCIDSNLNSWRCIPRMISLIPGSFHEHRIVEHP
jgi:hypothetical protein